MSDHREPIDPENKGAIALRPLQCSFLCSSVLGHLAAQRSAVCPIHWASVPSTAGDWGTAVQGKTVKVTQHRGPVILRISEAFKSQACHCFMRWNYPFNCIMRNYSNITKAEIICPCFHNS